MKPEDHIPLKPDAFHILLALTDAPLHGYALMKELAHSSDGQMVLLPGALYRRLQQLLDDGMLEEVDEPRSGGVRRRTFAITAFGRAVAEAEAHRLTMLVAAARRRHLIKEVEVES